MSVRWTSALAGLDPPPRHFLEQSGLSNPVVFAGALDVDWLGDGTVDEASVRSQLSDFLLSADLADDGMAVTTERLDSLDRLL